MKKGTVIFLEDSDLRRGETEFTFCGMKTEARKEVMTATMMVAGNKVLKNRYANTGIIIPEIINENGPILRSDIDNYKIIENLSDSYKERIISRIHEIIDIIHKVLGEPRGYDLYFNYGLLGKLNYNCIPANDEDPIEYVFSGLEIKTDEWDYRNRIPKKFLFMKNEDIISCIEESVRRCKNNKN